MPQFFMGEGHVLVEHDFIAACFQRLPCVEQALFVQVAQKADICHMEQRFSVLGIQQERFV